MRWRSVNEGGQEVRRGQVTRMCKKKPWRVKLIMSKYSTGRCSIWYQLLVVWYEGYGIFIVCSGVGDN